MAKQLTFTYNGKNYTLEFTRNTVRQMEQNGFVASEIDTKPLTVGTALFAGAFLAHHRNERQSVIDEIYALLPDKLSLIEKLAEMYNDPIAALLEEPEEGKNLNWTPNW